MPADRLADFVRAGSRVTHTAPAAVEGAHVVALAAAGAPPEALADAVRDPGLAPRVRAALRAAAAGDPVEALVDELGCAGFVTGWVNHTVPIALHLALTRADPVDAVRDAVRLGGDTDTVAAVAGAVCAARTGRVPAVDALRDAPLTGAAVAAFADAVAAGEAPAGFVGPRQAARNLATFARMLAWLPRRRLGGAW